MSEYADRIEAARRQRVERLREPEGWLSLVGLGWLHDGENLVGADPDSDVVLRGTEAPVRAGVVIVGDVVRFLADPRADVTHDGLPVTEIQLRDDVDGPPTILAIGSIRFHLVRRGERLGIRVRDRDAETLARFRGLDYFPIEPSWRVSARFEATPGATVVVPDVIGLVADEPSPGSVVFGRDGVEYRLLALEGEGEELWLVFGDATNGEETYAGGRFLYTEPPGGDGTVIVDFNLAYNPPCVFTPYATCPLPPPDNRLPVRVDAGERAWDHPTGPRLH